MGAQMIIPQERAEEGFSLLRDIVEMVKNPKGIDEAYERRRKAAMLSDDEVAKAAAARALITQADVVRAEMKKREDDLAANISSHNSAVETFTVNSGLARDALEKRAEELAVIAAAQSETGTSLKAEREKINVRALQIESDHVAWEKRYNERVNLIYQKEEAQKEEDGRLADLAKKLREKAAKLANLAQSDE